MAEITPCPEEDHRKHYYTEPNHTKNILETFELLQMLQKYGEEFNSSPQRLRYPAERNHTKPYVTAKIYVTKERILNLAGILFPAPYCRAHYNTRGYFTPRYRNILQTFQLLEMLEKYGEELNSSPRSSQNLTNLHRTGPNCMKPKQSCLYLKRILSLAEIGYPAPNENLLQNPLPDSARPSQVILTLFEFLQKGYKTGEKQFKFLTLVL